jgi:uncharacterized membrane protein YcaP (DUF421 family)
MQEFINQIFNDYSATLDIWQIGLRAVFVYLVTLAMVQLGNNKRFTGQYAALDVILGIVLGSTLSRTINGNAPLDGTLLAGFMLILFHWIFTRLAFHNRLIGTLFKGRARQLIDDGKYIDKTLRREAVSRIDMDEAIRGAGITDVSNVRAAYSERNGAISIIEKSDAGDAAAASIEVLNQTVEVQDGVQRVEIVVRMASR